MGGGGYVAGPVGLAATMKRIPLVLSEADSHLGLTNKAASNRYIRALKRLKQILSSIPGMNEGW